MPSSYSGNLLLELMADGENDGLWGDITNENLEILGRAISGVTTVSLSGTTETLTVTQGALSEGHFMVLELGGSPSGTNTITINPNTVARLYMVRNLSGQDAVFTQGSGGNVTVPNGKNAIIYCNGAGSTAKVTDITAGFMRGDNNLSDLDSAATALTNLGLTATAAELNKVDGFTGTATDLNYAKDLRATGVTTSEFDKLDGLTASTAELNELGDFANTFDLPTADGTSGQSLITDGSGTLSFGDTGAGDVVGPASSEDNYVAFFDGTTGKTIKMGPNGSTNSFFMNPDFLFQETVSSVCIHANVGGSVLPGFQGDHSVFIGDENTGPASSSANGQGYQVGIGVSAFPYATGTASLPLNTAIGAFAGNNLSTGDFNTYLGGSAGATGASLRQTGSNTTFVGANTGNDSVFRLDQNLSASNRIIMGNSSVTNAYIKVQWTVTSDARDKTDFAPLPQGLDVVDAIETYTFKFDDRSDYYVYDDDHNIIDKPEPDGSKKSEKTFVGFKAQQVEEVLNAAGFPSDVVVDTEDPDNLKMKETALIPLLINAVKELKARVEALEAGSA